VKTVLFTFVVLCIFLSIVLAGCGTMPVQATATFIPTTTFVPTDTPSSVPTVTSVPTTIVSWQDFVPGVGWNRDDTGSAECLAFTLDKCASWTYQGKGMVMAVFENTIVFDVEYYGDTTGVVELAAIRRTAKLFGVPDEVVEAVLALKTQDWNKSYTLDGWGYQANTIGSIEIIFELGGMHLK